jgi:hypothetical protein
MITVKYLQVDKIPINGLSQLHFFTEKDSNIYWGSDNNAIDPDDIARWLAEKKIVMLKEKILIEDDQILQIGGPESTVYVSRPLREELTHVGELQNLIVE